MKQIAQKQPLREGKTKVFSRTPPSLRGHPNLQTGQSSFNRRRHMPRLLDPTNPKVLPEGLMPQGHAANAVRLRPVPSMKRACPHRRVH